MHRRSCGANPTWSSPEPATTGARTTWISGARTTWRNQAVLHHVQARAHAAAGQADLCHRAIDLATQAHTDTTSTPPGPAHTWLATLHHPAGHAAATGHALATLATHTGHNRHIEEADRQLTTAINTYDHTTHTRAAALATTALAAMHIATGDPTTGHKWAQQAITTLPAVNSTRLRTALLALANTAEQHPHDPTSRELAAHIRNTITTTDPQPADSSQPQPTTTTPPGHQ